MKIRLIHGDITTQQVDAIVNAANPSLTGGGGVDGTIHEAAGPRLLEATKELRATVLPQGLAAGQAVATPAGNLDAQWVIHTVGPNRHVGQVNERLLASAFSESLDAAQMLGVTTIAFPAISAGAYGWDIYEVAVIAASVVQANRWPSIEEIRFVLFSEKALYAFQAAFNTAGIDYSD